MSLPNTEKHVKNIRRKTRRQFSSEQKIKIGLDGLRDEYSIAELCRREGINSNLYYLWSKDFLEARQSKVMLDNSECRFFPVITNRFPSPSSSAFY